MKPYKILLACTLLCGSISTNAQLVAYKTVLANGGTSYTSAGLSADWTVGQTVVNQYTSAGLTVTEGFHPTTVNSNATSVTTVKNNISSAIAYPNPANAVLHISIKQNEAKPVSIQVINVTGKIVLNLPVIAAAAIVNTDIDLSILNAGTYMILLNANTLDAYSMKVVKQ